MPAHRNIIGFVHAHEYTNYIILAIEYAPGGTLKDLIRSSRQNKQLLTEEKCRLIMRSLLNGLNHMHSGVDLVHRDLKPSNIVIQKLADLESVKIVDFGLAVRINSQSELNSTCGTLIYQAPEQIFTNAKQSKSIDIFASGLILYEMLTGEHPILKKGEDK